MKLKNLRTYIYNTFSQLKQRVSEKISRMPDWTKVMARIGLVSSLITFFVFVTGKNLPDILIVPPTTKLEDSTTEDKIGENSDKNNDVNSGESNDVNSGESNDVNSGESNGTSSDENSENLSPPIDEVNATVANTIGNNTESTEKLTMSRSAYRAELERAIGSDMCMVADYYTDFNHDGNFEMFALVTTREALEKNYVLEKRIYAHEESLLFILGQIWFVNQDGARNISITDSYASYDYWTVFDIISIGENKFLPCIKEALFADVAHLWGVTPSGEPYQSELSGYGSDILLNDYNEIEVFVSTHDFYFMEGRFTGRTYNPYYFYWDGANFKEYGGSLISIDSLYSISGSQKLLEQVYTELKEYANNIQIQEIYYRENGVININYQCKENSSDDNYYNYNVTLRYEDGELRIIPGEFGLLCKGLYHPALIPFIALFPETSFESSFGQVGRG